MEQALINELVRLLCKAGSEAFVGNFQKDCGDDGKYESWSAEEMAQALNDIRYMQEYFGKEEALAIVTSLIAKYDINTNDLSIRPATRNASPVQ